MQTLTLSLKNDSFELNFTTFQTIDCGPLNITLEDSNGSQTGITFQLLSMNDTENIERLLNSVEAVQRVGRIEVYLRPKLFASEVDIVFVFETNLDVDPAAVPTLRLGSENTLSCNEITSGLELEVVLTSLSTVQNLTNLSSFNLGFGGTCTPFLSIDAPSEELERELMNLFSWECTHNPPNGRDIFRESYDDNNARNDDMPAAYCGRNSKQSPGVVWEGGLQLRPQSNGNYNVSCCSLAK